MPSLPPFIAVDTETGGLNPRDHALLSISAVASWTPHEAITLYLWPLPGKLITEQAIEKNGYSEKEWRARGATDARAAIERLFNWWFDLRLKEQPDACTVAHQVGFDKGFLEETARLTGFEQAFELVFHRHRWRCSAAVLGLMSDLGLVPTKSCSLATLGELTGLWPSGGRPKVHEADADAQACRQGYEWMRQLLTGNLDLRTLERLSGDLRTAQAAIAELLTMFVVFYPLASEPNKEAFRRAAKALGTTPEALLNTAPLLPA